MPGNGIKDQINFLPVFRGNESALRLKPVKNDLTLVIFLQDKFYDFILSG